MVRGRSSSENALLGTKKAGTYECPWRPAPGTLKIRYLSWGQRISIEHTEGCAHAQGDMMEEKLLVGEAREWKAKSNNTSLRGAAGEATLLAFHLWSMALSALGLILSPPTVAPQVTVSPSHPYSGALAWLLVGFP